jgi:hypothetical protein
MLDPTIKIHQIMFVSWKQYVINSTFDRGPRIWSLIYVTKENVNFLWRVDGMAFHCNPNIYASYPSTLCQRSWENLFASFSVCYVFCINQRLSRSFLVFSSHTRWFSEFKNYAQNMCYKRYNETLCRMNYTTVPHSFLTFNTLVSSVTVKFYLGGGLQHRTKNLYVYFIESSAVHRFYRWNRNAKLCAL